jgi:hypothetical protein
MHQLHDEMCILSPVPTVPVWLADPGPGERLSADKFLLLLAHTVARIVFSSPRKKGRKRSDLPDEVAVQLPSSRASCTECSRASELEPLPLQIAPISY